MGGGGYKFWFTQTSERTFNAVALRAADEIARQINMLNELIFPDIKSIPQNCLPRPRIDVLDIMQVISSFDNIRELIEINPKKDKGFYWLHADGILSVDLKFKMQFGNRLPLNISGNVSK